ncbi:MAG: hypothetical protein HQL54_06695 [Magnetococcales bacterium]|nr:hypothetical protein [Magnetococcales bacterium]
MPPPPSEEELKAEAERRVPPVLNALELPGQLVAGESYTLRWSLLGYHDSYMSAAVTFNCEEAPAGECGKYYRDHHESSGKIDPMPDPDTDEVGTETDWDYSGIKAREFLYEFNFVAPDVDAPTEMVIRFYRISDIDEGAGNTAISLLVPGGLPNVGYYDTAGRRISVEVVPNNTDQ